MTEIGILGRRAAMAATVAVFLSLGAVGAFAAASPSLQRLALVLLLVPLVVPDAVRAFAWSRLLAPDGLVGQLLGRGYLDIGAGAGVLIAALSVSVVPLIFFSFVAPLPSPVATSWLAAREMPHQRWVFFRRLVLQAILPFLLVGLVTGVVFTFNSSAEEQYLGSSSTSIQKVTASLLNLDPGGALLGALGVYLFAATAISAAIGYGSFRIVKFFRARHRGAGNPLLRRAGRACIPFAGTVLRPLQALTLSVVLIGLWLPVPFLLLLAFGGGTPGRFPTDDFFRSAATSQDLRAAFINSTIIAVTSASIATVLAIYACRTTGRAKVVCLAATLWPALLPADVHARSIQEALRLFGLSWSGLSAVMLSHLSWLLPFLLLAVSFAYARIPRTLLDASREYGHTEAAVFTRVVIPLARPAILSAAIAVALLSFTEFRRGWHLAGGTEILSSAVFGTLQSGMVGQGARVFATAAVAVVVVLASSIAVAKLARQQL